MSADRKYPTTERGWEGLMRHDVPRKGRSSVRRPLSLKPPKCTSCGYWLAPNFDHSGCRDDL